MVRAMNIERGDILLVTFDPTVGAEIKKTRPGIVVTNNVANVYSQVLMIVPLTSQRLEKVFPHEVLISKSKGLAKDSKANVAQMRAVDRSRIHAKMGQVSKDTLKKLDVAMKLHLGLI